MYGLILNYTINALDLLSVFENKKLDKQLQCLIFTKSIFLCYKEINIHKILIMKISNNIKVFVINEIFISQIDVIRDVCDVEFPYFLDISCIR